MWWGDQSVDETITGAPRVEMSDVVYRPFPDPKIVVGDTNRPVWRVQFDLATDRNISFGLDINGDVVLGRAEDSPDLLDLSAFGAESFGVSRRHAVLRPTGSKLIVLDLGSTNGTWQNGRSIGVNTPYALTNGDILTLGRLEFIVRIVRRPTGQTQMLRERADLGDALSQLAKAITSQLDLDDVFNQALEMAMGLTDAGEVAIWLVDEQTGDLFLEAGRGIESEEIMRLRLPVSDSLAGEVIETGKARRTNRRTEGDQIKVKTGYIVEALVYVPLALGGVTFGVLAAAHREGGRKFSEREEKLLTAIADFAAIAIQNSRLYQATDQALAERVEELTEVNNALAHDLKGALTSIKGYAHLIKMSGTLSEPYTKFIGNVIMASDRMLGMINSLLDIALLSQAPQADEAPCDLAEAVSTAVQDLEGAALVKSITLDLKREGAPYQIRGDGTRLYRCVLNLIDNAIKYSPEGTLVSVSLAFDQEGVTIQVRDAGSGIPEEDLHHIFDKYYRGEQSSGDQAGIGLGLAMVQAMVHAHGGEISARNLEEGGAEFSITLPADLRID
jgi:signal transduction histidine kinase